MSSTDDRRRFYRVRELCEMIGVSKGKVFTALREGKLEGLKLEGVLLVTAESVERYLETAIPWTPRVQPQSVSARDRAEQENSTKWNRMQVRKAKSKSRSSA